LLVVGCLSFPPDLISGVEFNHEKAEVLTIVPVSVEIDSLVEIGGWMSGAMRVNLLHWLANWESTPSHCSGEM
jgi:hypothetical protein